MVMSQKMVPEGFTLSVMDFGEEPRLLITDLDEVPVTIIWLDVKSSECFPPIKCNRIIFSENREYF